jgi:hypothetical protein
MNTDKRANDLRLLNERRAELKRLLEKYGPALTKFPHSRFPNKTLRDDVTYAIERGSLAVVRSTLAIIRRREESKDLDVHASPMTDSYVVAYGRTYGLNERFQTLGFSIKKFGATWAWYREVLADKAEFFQTAAKAIGPGIETFFIRNFDGIENAIVEAKEMDREMAVAQPKPEIESHHLDGAVFEVGKFTAYKLKEEKNTPYLFRNLKIIKIKRETAKAYLVDAEFFSGIASSCGFCGLELNNDVSRASGIGPICAKKHGFPRLTMATAKIVVAELEAKSKASGMFTDFWIAKSQIKNIVDTNGNHSRNKDADEEE